MCTFPTFSESLRTISPTSDRQCWRLRRVQEGDLAMLLEHRNRGATRRWLENEEPISPEQQRKWYSSGDAECVRIIEYDKLAIGIGRIGLPSQGEVLVGLDIFEGFRGKGFGFPAFCAVCAEAETKSRRLALWVFLENRPAVSIYRRSGFVEDPMTAVRYLPRDLLADSRIKNHAYVKMFREK
jgi:GNAT superfamily N-acetyltransferase